ncbi:MAG: hypothetical protein IPL74_04240 [Bacteroidetes bacterium]|nr:hypothetical protein [Bacteroidota bacterium]
MFQRICVRQNDPTFKADIGFIAESLLYYKQVILIAGQQTLPTLLRHGDIGIIHDLLSSKLLGICVCEDMLGVGSQINETGRTEHVVTSFTSDLLKTEALFLRLFFGTQIGKGYSRRAVQRILLFVETVLFNKEIGDMVREDLSEESYTKSAICDMIRYYSPEYDITPNQFEYSYMPTGNENWFGGKTFYFDTNLDFEKINRAIADNPDGKKLSITQLMLNILETRGDMHLASQLDAEIATSAIHTSLMKLKFKEIYTKTTKSKDEIFQFNEFTLDNGNAIAETLNDGTRDFRDFIKVLEKAEKFKGWLDSIGEDKSIIKEYYKAVSSDTWIDKLPNKVASLEFLLQALD